jgi:DNA-binding beta-propeller fold protein YncE
MSKRPCAPRAATTRVLSRVAFAAVLGVAIGTLPVAAHAQGFVNFEAGLVRPLALSPDGLRLFATNAPDNRLEVFDIVGDVLVHAQSVPVGLEPVAIAVRSASEVWVVNHLSDSISIVNVGTSPARVTRTLLTCDEPRDIVFAGPGGNRAFITTARRGQNCPVAANLTTPGTPRAIVQVFDATNLGASLGGTPVANVALFGDTPRALATDGTTVYAAVFHSGNQTVAVQETAVCNGGQAAAPCNVSGLPMPGGLPAPNRNQQNILGPEVGLIVKLNQATGDWEDELGRDWSNAVRFDLPDLDVFAINATSMTQVDDWASVGTVLFNMAVNPLSGKVYVSNTDARNEVRFEGPGITHTTVNGHLHEARVTVLDGATVNPRHLNKHIDYDQLVAPASVKADSLATPVGMAVTSDGATLYVAAFGSAKIGVFNTSELEADSFQPDSDDHIELSAGGPAGLVLNENTDRLYVLTRFDSSISVIDTNQRQEIDHVSMHSPEPSGITGGRRFLYDAQASSSNGEASCSSCHIFGDFDSLAWDLGNPDDDVLNNPLPFRIGPLPPVPNSDPDFHPLKGPMTTQTLRGMAGHGSMHWRGDRTGGNDPDSNDFDEFRAFEKFNPAFPGLLGRASELDPEDMASFAEFILTVTMPPNPVRALDNSLNANQQAGRNFYFGPISDTVFNCNGCHTLNPAQGFFGGDGFSTFEGETQMFKVPHLRNAYQKVGMFGILGLPHQGPQVRGTGYLHDGAVDTVFHFLQAGVFQMNNTQRQQVEQFIMAFDSNLAPIVGQQITLTATNAVTVNPRIDLLIARDTAGECDVVVKGILSGEERGGVRNGAGQFQMDRSGDVRTDVALRALALVPGQELTYTCAPPGAGARIGTDRDGDGFLDRDETDSGHDPADPGSFPGAPVRIRASNFKLRDDATPPVDATRRRLTFKSAPSKGLPSGVVVPAFGSSSDPTTAGATVVIYQVGGSTGELVTLNLPAANWSQTGTAAKPGYKYRDPQGIQGPINSAVLRNGRLTIRGRGAQLYPLADAPQGTMALRMNLGGSLTWCAAAPARTPSVSFDTTARFEGVKNSPAPASCPALPSGYGSPSRAFLATPASLLD